MNKRPVPIMTPCSMNEFPPALVFLDRCFKKPQKNWFTTHYTHIFQTTPQSTSNHWLYKEGKEILGLIGVYPFTMRIGKARLKVAGIGSVSVDPDARGKGIMSLMLEDTINRIRSGDFDLSWLGGDRFRYKNYGWDMGGKKVIFKISKKYLDLYHPQIKPVKSAKPQEKDIPHLMKMHNSFATGVMRTPAIWKVHIARPNLLWRIVRKEKGGAYLVSYKDTPTSILEIRGEATSVIALLKNYLIEHTLDSVVIAHPNTSDPVFGLLHESAVDFHVENCDQIQILNVDSTWNKIVPAIAGNKFSRSMLDSVALKDRSLVLGRVFGFLDGIPGFPKRLMHLNQIRPVDWWIPDTDKV